jgi:hypothetical protein
VVEWLQNHLDRLLHNRNNNQKPIAKPRIATATIQYPEIRFTSNRMATIDPIINSKMGYFDALVGGCRAVSNHPSTIG